VSTGVEGIFHVGITVSHMERSLRFYRDALGLEVESDAVIDHPYVFALTAVPAEEIRVAFLRVPRSGSGNDGSTRVELLEYRGIERHTVEGRPCDPGRSHICLQVGDVDEVHRRLTVAGYRGRSKAPVEYGAGPRKGARAIYAVDPDGYNVELYQPPGDVSASATPRELGDSGAHVRPSP